MIHDDDAQIEAWHAGYHANRKGLPRPTNQVEAAGWDHRESLKGVTVVMPARPEGYYHQKPEGE